MNIRSYAKINLGLDVLGKRTDGYHIVSMVMQSVDLHDELAIDMREDDSITITCDHPLVPTDSRNLAYKAAKYMIDRFDLDRGVDIRIYKRIPVAAGLAGGSGNCAAVIRAMNELYDLKLNESEMMELGLRFGADVPYCICQRPMLARGIGEKLEPVEGLSDCTILISKPDASLSTAEIYKGLGYEASDDETISELIDENPMDELIGALKEHDINKAAGLMYNDLEPVSMKLEPRIRMLKQFMKDNCGSRNGFAGALMSGSGPSVFGIYTDRELAENVAQLIRDELKISETFVCSPINGI